MKNDPCPCQSGLKYRQCCWLKRFSKPVPAPAPSVPKADDRLKAQHTRPASVSASMIATAVFDDEDEDQSGDEPPPSRRYAAGAAGRGRLPVHPPRAVRYLRGYIRLSGRADLHSGRRQEYRERRPNAGGANPSPGRGGRHRHRCPPVLRPAGPAGPPPGREIPESRGRHRPPHRADDRERHVAGVHRHQQPRPPVLLRLPSGIRPRPRNSRSGSSC